MNIDIHFTDSSFLLIKAYLFVPMLLLLGILEKYNLSGDDLK